MVELLSALNRTSQLLGENIQTFAGYACTDSQYVITCASDSDLISGLTQLVEYLFPSSHSGIFFRYQIHFVGQDQRRAIHDLDPPSSNFVIPRVLLDFRLVFRVEDATASVFSQLFPQNSQVVHWTSPIDPCRVNDINQRLCSLNVPQELNPGKI